MTPPRDQPDRSGLCGRYRWYRRIWLCALPL